MNYFSSIENVKNADDFYHKIKIISELFMHHMEIENLDETTIFLAEAISLCVMGYEKTIENKSKV